MPGSHRDDDVRFCGATTIVSGQSKVYVNNKFWAVEGDENSHGEGRLIAVYGSGKVRINGIKVICAVGDKAHPDNKFHPMPPTDPAGASSDVYVYEGGDATV